MRCLERNKVVFFYCPYTGKEDVKDASNFFTGEKRITYGTAVEVYGNISPANGQSVSREFGNEIRYDRVIVLEDPKFPMDENSVLFVEKSPAYDASGNPLYDYTVSAVARSLNSVSYAIRKVSVS